MARVQLPLFLGVGLILGTLHPKPALGAGRTQSDSDIEESVRVFNRAKSLHQEKQYQEAIKEYQAALKLDNQNPFIYNSLGLALAAIGSFKDALKSFNQAIQLNPDLTDVYNNMGMVYAEQGDRDKAFEAFTRAVRNPNYPTPEKALYNLGNLYLNDGNLELAVMHFKRSVEKQPKFALGYRGLGNVYLRLKELDQAVTQFKKAVELAPEDVESIFQLARIHQQRGELEEAQKLYRRVVEVDRSSTFGQMSLASLDALKKKGS